jgi:ribonuclease HII
MKLCGIDEAGRGPIIGPLVMAGCMIEEKDIPKLKALGVKDSKLLTKSKREELFDKIMAISVHYILIVEPEEIDAALNHPELNLNWLEALKIAEIINNLKPDKVIIDAPSTNIAAFQEYLLKHLENQEINLQLEHKADEKYEVVSAASILAKVIRDREIEKISKEHGNVGSGYPSDPHTKEFLKKNWDKHDKIFRKTWETYKRLEKTKKQKSLNDY